MPHICMNCGKKYEDDSEELLKGCSCGSTLFLFEKDIEDQTEDESEDILEENSKEAKKSKKSSNKKQHKDTIVEEIDSFLKNLKAKFKKKTEIKFDLESIKVIKEGVYEINIGRLLEKMPLIIEIKEGSYNIHLPSAFKPEGFETFDIKELEDLRALIESKVKKSTKKKGKSKKR